MLTFIILFYCTGKYNSCKHPKQRRRLQIGIIKQIRRHIQNTCQITSIANPIFKADKRRLFLINFPALIKQKNIECSSSFL